MAHEMCSKEEWKVGRFDVLYCNELHPFRRELVKKNAFCIFHSDDLREREIDRSVVKKQNRRGSAVEQE